MKKFRTKYETKRVVKSFSGVRPLTEQQYKSECDLYTILRKHGGIPPAERMSLNMDVSEMGDFAECMTRVKRSMDEFMELPSELRMRFGNDPRAFYSWVVDPNNMNEAIRLGLLTRRSDEPTPTELLKDIADSVKKDVTPEGHKTA